MIVRFIVKFKTLKKRLLQDQRTIHRMGVCQVCEEGSQIFYRIHAVLWNGVGIVGRARCSFFLGAFVWPLAHGDAAFGIFSCGCFFDNAL